MYVCVAPCPNAIREHLAGHMEKQHLMGNMVTKPKRLLVDGSLVRRLDDWLSRQSSPRLWVHGHELHQTIGAIVWDTALQKGRNTLEHSISPSRGELVLSYSERLTELVHSYLFQILQHIPEVSATVLNITREEMAQLNCTFDSIPVALKVISQALCLVPRVICIVEGLQHLTGASDASIEKELRDFIDLFRSPLGGNLGSGSSGAKLLITTRNPSGMLCEMFPHHADHINIAHLVGTDSTNLSRALADLQW